MTVTSAKDLEIQKIHKIMHYFFVHPFVVVIVIMQVLIKYLLSCGVNSCEENDLRNCYGNHKVEAYLVLLLFEVP